MPLTTVRWSLAGRPVRGFCVGNSGWSRSHCASVSSERSMPTRIVRYEVCGDALMDEPVLVGVGGGLCPRRERKLGEDVADVAGDGLLAEEELSRDRAVGLPGCQERQDLSLARAQAIVRFRGGQA